MTWMIWGSLILGRPLYKPKLVQETNWAIEIWAPLVNARRNDPKAARLRRRLCLFGGHHWSCQFAACRLARNGWRSRFQWWTYWTCEIGLVAPKSMRHHFPNELISTNYP